jgi:glycerophosphoryl diester phosphodiesterase
MSGMPRPLLLGHRGARAHRTIAENTFPSFDLALRNGCDGFEFDVRLTADREAVICHDPEWRDDTGPLSWVTPGVTIADARRAELQKLPLLSDVLRRYRSSAFLDIELKVTGLGPSLVDALRETGPGPGLVISSFLPQVLLEIHDADHSLPLGLICETAAQIRVWPEFPISFVIPHHSVLTPALLDALQAAGKQVLVWTVNTADAMRRFADWGVQGIISDETELLVETLGEKQ